MKGDHQKGLRTKEEYLKELHFCLKNLSEELRNDILMEFKGIIEDKINQNPHMSEEDLLRSFESPHLISQKYEEELGKEKKGEKEYFLKSFVKDIFNSINNIDRSLFSQEESKERVFEVPFDENIKKVHVDVLNLDIKIYHSEEPVFILQGSVIPQEALLCEKRGDVLYMKQESKKYSGTLILKVPKFLDLHGVTLSGDVFVEDREGKVKIITTSGDIAVQKIENEVNLVSKSGDIEAVDILGDLHMQSLSGDLSLKKGRGMACFATASGDILVEENQGDLFLESKSGDLEIEDASSGDVVGKTLSGDICLKSLFETKNIKLNTISGNIEVKYSQEFCWQIKPSTVSGEIVLRNHSSLSPLLKDIFDMDFKTISGDILVEQL